MFKNENDLLEITENLFFLHSNWHNPASQCQTRRNIKRKNSLLSFTPNLSHSILLYDRLFALLPSVSLKTVSSKSTAKVYRF